MTKRIREHETIYRSVLVFAKILAFFGLSSCSSFFPSSQEPIPKTDEFDVLFIGNSYSFGVPKMFEELAQQNGKKVHVESCTNGGWTLKKHSGHRSTLKKLRERKWDVVVIQEFSLGADYSESRRRSKMYPCVRFFVNEAQAIGARPILYQTWGRRDGRSGWKGDDFYQMNERIRVGYAGAAENAGGIDIAPVGDAWEAEFRKGHGEKLFVEDGSHPSQFGDQVSAKVFYEVIFPK
jgi:hypothetical protein